MNILVVHISTRTQPDIPRQTSVKTPEPVFPDTTPTMDGTASRRGRVWMTSLQKVVNDPECHSREHVPSMGRRAMSGSGAKSILIDESKRRAPFFKGMTAFAVTPWMTFLGARVSMAGGSCRTSRFASVFFQILDFRGSPLAANSLCSWKV